MKTRFTTVDLVASVKEINASLTGMRVVQVYDIDNKTYLIKLAKPDNKAVLLLESGNRIHFTEFEWPKNVIPSGFSMKLRKHIRSRRLEKVIQLGIDRIIDLQFGSNEAAYHVILELYDRGNIVLTDHQYTILNILRPRTEESTDVRFAVRERYPIEAAKQEEPLISQEELQKILLSGKENELLRKILNPHLAYGPALIDHILLGAGFSANVKIGKGFSISEDISRLRSAFEEADKILKQITIQDTKGYIIYKYEQKPSQTKDSTDKITSYMEFHPILFRQHENGPYLEFPCFSKAVDDFFSKLETQKLDLKTLQQEKAVLKKLDNVKKDHEKRVSELEKLQDQDKKKAQLIEMNLPLVDRGIKILCSAIANQIDWSEINNLLQESRTQGDPVALAIKKLKLETNHFTMLLRNPYTVNLSDEEEDEDDDDVFKPTLIDIDLGLSAYANARKYYGNIRFAARKQQKTIESSEKAYKSAEKKTKQTLKEVAIVASINKARKTFWFEKFLWFISSENYLIIAGRDQQQNEMVVKRYLKAGDYYVHADLHGATSVVIKNSSGNPIPPKTLNEAGSMAVCYSAAWEAKIVTSAWWVYHHQVSKTAPSGEYLTTGSFMIRGKKNYLPPCHLILGFGFLFKLEETCLFRHKDERRVRTTEEESLASVSESIVSDVEIAIEISEGEDDVIEEAQEQENPGITEIPEISENCEESDSSFEFPDTSIKLEYVEADKFKLQLEKQEHNQDEDDVIYLGDNIPVKISNKEHKKRDPKRKQNKIPPVKPSDDAMDNIIEQTAPDKTKQSQPQLKRGQRSKLKKMKKYQNQDEEERQLFMELLASSGSNKEKKSKKKTKQAENQNKLAGKKQQESKQNKQKEAPVHLFMEMENLHLNTENESSKIKKLAHDADNENTNETELKEENHLSDEEKDGLLNEESVHNREDENILNSLTGCPNNEDILLFAVQMCAPYSALTNYKFKVKLTPGTGKRGKAAKTALDIFLHDKMATQREKDLFKSVKDQDISRNFPGKVKVSAPQLLKQKMK